MSDIPLSIKNITNTQVVSENLNKKNTSVDLETEKGAKELSDFLSSNILQVIYQEEKPDELFGGGFAEELMRSFLLEEYGKNITEKDELKFKQEFSKELIKIQSRS